MLDIVASERLLKELIGGLGFGVEVVFGAGVVFGAEVAVGAGVANAGLDLLVRGEGCSSSDSSEHLWSSNSRLGTGSLQVGHN